MGAGKFKNECLALLDEVAETGVNLIITKRGRPVAKLVPVSEPPPVTGSVLRFDADVDPAVAVADWEMLSER